MANEDQKKGCCMGLRGLGFEFGLASNPLYGRWELQGFWRQSLVRLGQPKTALEETNTNFLRTLEIQKMEQIKNNFETQTNVTRNIKTIPQSTANSFESGRPANNDQLKDSKEALEIVYQMNKLIGADLDKETLSLLMKLLDMGIEPEALALITQELKSAK